MSKELDALERGIIEFEKELEDDCNNEWLKRVITGMKKCHQRLETLENSKPSEALEKFDYIGNDVIFAYDDDFVSYDYTDDVEYIKQYILKAQEQEKVLEIIKKKRVDIDLLNTSSNAEEYNFKVSLDKELTQEDFDTLKRYFK